MDVVAVVAPQQQLSTRKLRDAIVQSVVGKALLDGFSLKLCQCVTPSIEETK